MSLIKKIKEKRISDLEKHLIPIMKNIIWYNKEFNCYYYINEDGNKKILFDVYSNGNIVLRDWFYFEMFTITNNKIDIKNIFMKVLFEHTNLDKKLRIRI